MGDALFTDPTRVDADLRAHAAAASGRWSLTEDDAIGAGDAATARMLRGLLGATADRLRLMLVTPTHKDARMTAFLTTWAFERHWFADALGRALGERAATPASARRLPRRRGAGTVREALSAGGAGDAFVVVSVVEALVEQAVLEALTAALETPIGGRGAAELAVQSRFLSAEAARRLPDADARTQRRIRRRLGRWMLPARSDDVAYPDAWVALDRAFPTPAALADASARLVDLPGLAGVRLVRDPRRPVLRIRFDGASAVSARVR